MIAKIKSTDPYTEIADIIEEWCLKNYYDRFVVTLQINGETITEWLDWCIEYGFIWDTDWWEGEKDVVLVGFRPLHQISFDGYPEAYKG